MFDLINRDCGEGKQVSGCLDSLMDDEIAKRVTNLAFKLSVKVKRRVAGEL